MLDSSVQSIYSVSFSFFPGSSVLTRPCKQAFSNVTYRHGLSELQGSGKCIKGQDPCCIPCIWPVPEFLNVQYFEIAVISELAKFHRTFVQLRNVYKSRDGCWLVLSFSTITQEAARTSLVRKNSRKNTSQVHVNILKMGTHRTQKNPKSPSC